MYKTYKLWRKLLRNPYCLFNRDKFFYNLAPNIKQSCPPWLKNKDNDEDYRTFYRK